MYGEEAVISFLELRAEYNSRGWKIKWKMESKVEPGQ